jgi:hypothetical protein
MAPRASRGRAVSTAAIKIGVACSRVGFGWNFQEWEFAQFITEFDTELSLCSGIWLRPRAETSLAGIFWNFLRIFENRCEADRLTQYFRLHSSRYGTAALEHVHALASRCACAVGGIFTCIGCYACQQCFGMNSSPQSRHQTTIYSISTTFCPCYTETVDVRSTHLNWFL